MTKKSLRSLVCEKNNTAICVCLRTGRISRQIRINTALYGRRARASTKHGRTKNRRPCCRSRAVSTLSWRMIPENNYFSLRQRRTFPHKVGASVKVHSGGKFSFCGSCKPGSRNIRDAARPSEGAAAFSKQTCFLLPLYKKARLSASFFYSIQSEGICIPSPFCIMKFCCRRGYPHRRI